MQCLSMVCVHIVWKFLYDVANKYNGWRMKPCCCFCHDGLSHLTECTMTPYLYTVLNRPTDTVHSFLPAKKKEKRKQHVLCAWENVQGVTS
jgi:hypothetical protein